MSEAFQGDAESWLISQVLPGMFASPKFRRIRPRVHRGEVDGLTIGVALATKNPRYGTFALNASDVDLLSKAKADKRADHAFVVFATPSNSGPHVYCGAVELTRLLDQIRDLPTRKGEYGPFWVLPHHVSDEFDEPF